MRYRNSIVKAIATATFAWWYFVANPLPQPDNIPPAQQSADTWPDGAPNGMHVFDRVKNPQAACKAARADWIATYLNQYPDAMVNSNAIAGECEKAKGPGVGPHYEPDTNAPAGSNVNAATID